MLYCKAHLWSRVLKKFRCHCYPFFSKIGRLIRLWFDIFEDGWSSLRCTALLDSVFVKRMLMENHVLLKELDYVSVKSLLWFACREFGVAMLCNCTYRWHPFGLAYKCDLSEKWQTYRMYKLCRLRICKGTQGIHGTQRNHTDLHHYP